MIIKEYYDVPGVNFGPLLGSFQDYNCKSKTILSLLQQLPSNVAKGILNTGAGVEVEVEGCRPKDLAGWSITEDHSLRNNGVEFISKIGKRVHNLFPMLEQLFTQATEQKWEISDRTSIHVHINVQNLTFEQLNSLIILYTVFERSLFAYASDERRNNIFCVPLEYCMTNGQSSVRALIEHSAKYSAMNLRAVREKGTVEFRHMLTNFDSENVFKWVLLLALLKRAAQHTPLMEVKTSIKSLKYSSDYDKYMKKIFYNFASLLNYKHKDIDAAISDSKLFFFGD